MAHVQVSYTHKYGSHYNPHERIEGIAGTGGGGWYRTEDRVINDLQTRLNSYFVSVNGEAVAVTTAQHNGRTYIKTVADGYAPNNLLNLPEPPANLIPQLPHG